MNLELISYQDFNPQNISFNWDNQIDYIDNTTYYNNPNHGLTSTTPPTIFSVNNHQDGIDIYLYDDSVGGGGLANGVGESSEFYVTGSYWKTPNNSLTKSHVISHEMGYVLYLWHTHHGTYNEGGNDNPCPELVNGSNSATCGDYVTDTSADPHLQFDVNQSTCEWNNSATDANDDLYNPDEKNVMSYTDINCMEYFTPKQGERMRNAITTLSYLQQTVTDNCLVQKLSSIEQLCYANSQTLIISNISNNSTTWQVSSNVTISSSNNNSITVRASSSNSTGNGWVRATFNNGIVLQEDFRVGKPKAYTRYPDSTICANVFLQDPFYTLPVSPGAISYNLTSNSPYLFVENTVYPETEIFMTATRAGRYTVTLTTTNSCGSSQATIYVTAERCAGFFFRTYPNPTSESLTIEKLEKNSTTSRNKAKNIVKNFTISSDRFELYNLRSELVRSGQLKELTNIDVSSLKKGTYILKIHVNGNIETHQIIIK